MTKSNQLNYEDKLMYFVRWSRSSMLFTLSWDHLAGSYVKDPIATSLLEMRVSKTFQPLWIIRGSKHEQNQLFLNFVQMLNYFFWTSVSGFYWILDQLHKCVDLFQWAFVWLRIPKQALQIKLCEFISSLTCLFTKSTI